MMKIIFDFDGVLTDFNRFIQENGIDYFQKRFHMTVVLLFVRNVDSECKKLGRYLSCVMTQAVLACWLAGWLVFYRLFIHKTCMKCRGD